ncbi:hypothetical protein QA612_10945 [Evansella sp. AB-P1]|uniref:hypothetical protein n=1 Tax=Evansella sp. AB-P1 TaxID=3037653 RepID=UPI002420240A|nr:hypothetical protein [Evansella sp. AB-P1]MDG5788006.1 hypothetical protein [Evansella sp. AB-P1]
MGLALEEPESADTIVEVNGVRVAIDPVIKSQTEMMTIDYEERNGKGGLLMKGLDDCC